jgi:hypothetical protein
VFAKYHDEWEGCVWIRQSVARRHSRRVWVINILAGYTRRQLAKQLMKCGVYGATTPHNTFRCSRLSCMRARVRAFNYTTASVIHKTEVYHPEHSYVDTFPYLTISLPYVGLKLMEVKSCNCMRGRFLL